MKLMLTGRNVEVTPALRQQVVRRLARLERVLGDAALSAQVVLQSEKYRLVTDLTLHMRGDHVLTGVGGATTWPLSIKEAAERIEQQGQRVKEKWTTRKRRATGGKRLPVPLPAEPEPAADAERKSPRIYRVRAGVRPLTIDDAAIRLEAGTEPAIVFRNADTGRLAVVFRRKDGNVALVEPER
jgi:putative sigma-54 modulation protein